MAVLLGLELSGVTTVSLIIVGVIIALALVAWSFFKTYMFFFNTKAMFKQLDDCANAEDFALMTLEKYNLGQVEVKVGMVLTGYSSRKRKIYMSRFVARRSTISSISRAMQLVCLAKIDITNEAAHKKALHHTYFNYAATVVFFCNDNCQYNYCGYGYESSWHSCFNRYDNCVCVIYCVACICYWSVQLA
ncbi:MAG: hypothetical protein RR348_00490 [Clostridia bacterium]